MGRSTHQALLQRLCDRAGVELDVPSSVAGAEVLALSRELEPGERDALTCAHIAALWEVVGDTHRADAWAIAAATVDRKLEVVFDRSERMLTPSPRWQMVMFGLVGGALTFGAVVWLGSNPLGLPMPHHKTGGLLFLAGASLPVLTGLALAFGIYVERQVKSLRFGPSTLEFERADGVVRRLTYLELANAHRAPVWIPSIRRLPDAVWNAGARRSTPPIGFMRTQAGLDRIQTRAGALVTSQAHGLVQAARSRSGGGPSTLHKVAWRTQTVHLPHVAIQAHVLAGRLRTTDAVDGTTVGRLATKDATMWAALHPLRVVGSAWFSHGAAAGMLVGAVFGMFMSTLHWRYLHPSSFHAILWGALLGVCAGTTIRGCMVLGVWVGRKVRARHRAGVTLAFTNLGWLNALALMALLPVVGFQLRHPPNFDPAVDAYYLGDFKMSVDLLTPIVARAGDTLAARYARWLFSHAAVQLGHYNLALDVAQDWFPWFGGDAPHQDGLARVAAYSGDCTSALEWMDRTPRHLTLDGLPFVRTHHDAGVYAACSARLGREQPSEQQELMASKAGPSIQAFAVAAERVWTQGGPVDSTAHHCAPVDTRAPPHIALGHWRAALVESLLWGLCDAQAVALTAASVPAHLNDDRPHLRRILSAHRHWDP